MWDLIVSVPDHCLSFYFEIVLKCLNIVITIICEPLDRFKILYETGYCNFCKDCYQFEKCHSLACFG